LDVQFTRVGETHAALRWLWHDLPYITMLVLAVVGVIFRLPFAHWVILTPVFGVISIATGWHHFATRDARLELVYRLALSWSAILVAIYLLFSGGVHYRRGGAGMADLYGGGVAVSGGAGLGLAGPVAAAAGGRHRGGDCLRRPAR
jgi:hypothetical protein